MCAPPIYMQPFAARASACCRVSPLYGPSSTPVSVLCTLGRAGLFSQAREIDGVFPLLVGHSPVQVPHQGMDAKEARNG